MDDLEFERTERMVDRVLAGDDVASPLAARLRDALRLEVSPHAEAAHLNAIAGLGGRAPIPRAILPRHRPRRALVSLLAAALILVLGASSALAASESATPGNPLYGLKRAAERLSLAMHRSPSSRAEVHLRMADRRIAEIRAVVRRGRDATALDRDLALELDAARSEAERAIASGRSADAVLAHVQAELERHLERLNELLAIVPDAARPGIERAIDRASNAQARVQRGRNEQREKNTDRMAPDRSPTPRDSHPSNPNGKPSRVDNGGGHDGGNDTNTGGGNGNDKASDHPR